MGKKYRYFMNGMFLATDGKEYNIDIPSPFSYDSQEEAMSDAHFGYRFVKSKNDEPCILVFKNETCSKVGDGKNAILRVHVENLIKIYDFSEFKKLGGGIHIYIDVNRGFIEVSKTFKELFPTMETGKLYYIDNEAYYIDVCK